MKHFIDNENQVKIDNEGRVKMFYVLAHNHAGGNHDDTKLDDEHACKEDSPLQECNIIGSIFQQKVSINGDSRKLKTKSICYNFNEKIKFPI